MSIFLSICVTAYNQSELVRKSISELVKCTDPELEFIISDDCSTENIPDIVNEFVDQRLKYCRTPKNVGHDLNIVHALKHCSGEYALVLRSKDLVIPTRISNAVKLLKKNANVAYALFTALDQDGGVAVHFRDKVYRQGRKALSADSKLIIHPSGNFYNLRLIDFDMVEKAFSVCKEKKYGFVIHSLIRTQLAFCGNFLTSSIPVWIYNRLKPNDAVAVNKVPGMSVYDPKLEYVRYECELCFAHTCSMQYVFNSGSKEYLLCHIIKRYYKRISYDFDKINRDENLKKHYQYESVVFNRREERKNFRKITYRLMKNFNLTHAEVFGIRLFIYFLSVKLKFYFPIRDVLLELFFSEPNRERLVAFIKRI